MNIWQSLTKPIFALAPMEDVTDTVFRQIVASCARPDLFFTEFTNVDGVQSEGRDAVIHRLKFTDSERPIIAQLWGSKPEHYCETAKMIADLGFDGIDINMGCPQKNVTSHGACAALITNQRLAKEIILATKEGAASRAGRGMPVSVKTRIGFKKIETEKWISFLLSLDLDAITVHGRTAAQTSATPANWDEIGKAVAIRNQLKKKTVILGNGDVASYADGVEKWRKYGTDGVVVGRAILDNLWVFDKSKKPHQPTLKESLELMRTHVKLFDKTWRDTRNFAILKKYFQMYVRGFDGASGYRIRLMDTQRATDVYPIIDEIFEKMSF
jgi:tRNA-dihydrouridine synthase